MLRTRPSTPLLTLLVAATAWLATAGTAQAHTGLSSSTPADGGTVTEAPTAVTLDFSGTVRGPEVLVSGPDGAELTTGPASADGSVVSVPVAVTASGVHTVRWSVTSADGHDLTGTTTFTVTVPEPAPTTPAPTTSAAPPSSATPSLAAGEAEEEADDGPNLLVRSLQTLLVLAAVTGIVVLVRRRR